MSLHLRDIGALIAQHPKRLRAFRDELLAARRVIDGVLAVDTEGTGGDDDTAAPSLFDALIAREDRTVDRCCWLVATPLDIVRAHLLPYLTWGDQRVLARTCRHFARLFYSCVTRVAAAFDRDDPAPAVWHQLAEMPLVKCHEITIRPTRNAGGIDETDGARCRYISARLFERVSNRDTRKCWFNVFVDGTVPDDDGARVGAVPRAPLVSPRFLAVIVQSATLESYIPFMDIDMSRVEGIALYVDDVASTYAANRMRMFIVHGLMSRAPLARLLWIRGKFPFSPDWTPQITELVCMTTPQWVDTPTAGFARLRALWFTRMDALREFLSSPITSGIAPHLDAIVFDVPASKTPADVNLVFPRDGVNYRMRYTDVTSVAFRARHAARIEWTRHVAFAL